jgi:hypothetical protein
MVVAIRPSLKKLGAIASTLQFFDTPSLMQVRGHSQKSVIFREKADFFLKRAGNAEKQHTHSKRLPSKMAIFFPRRHRLAFTTISHHRCRYFAVTVALLPPLLQLRCSCGCRRLAVACFTPSS